MSPRRPTNERLEELITKKAQLDAQIATLDARRRSQTKKDEDRMKWLLGNLVFDNLSAEPALQSPALLEMVRRDLPERLTQRDKERGLWEKLFPETSIHK